MNMDIAGRLVERRKAAGFSQEDVAAKIGVSRQAVSKWECGESSPDTDNLIALANLYCVSIDDLLFADPKGIVAVHTVPTDDGENDAEEGTENGAESDPAAEGANEGSAWEAGAAFARDYFRSSRDAYEYDDGEDYVDISLENGVHVRDRAKGEEVHVGWDGVHVDCEDDNTHVHISFKQFFDALRKL